jgi:hypothetical protein
VKAAAIASISRSQDPSKIPATTTVSAGRWSPRTSARTLVFTAAYERSER